MSALHISQLAQQQKFIQSNLLQKELDVSKSKSAEHSSPKTSSIDSRHIDRLFIKMTEVYAHKFTSAYGVVDSGIWLSTLHDLNPYEIKNGLEHMAQPGTKYADFPPTPFAFRELCRPTKEPSSKTYIDFTGCAALPKPIDKDKAMAALREIRQKLGKAA